MALDLKRCPCGKIPANICVDDNGRQKWSYAYGDWRYTHKLKGRKYE